MTTDDIAAEGERLAWLNTCSLTELNYLLGWFAGCLEEFDRARAVVERTRADEQVAR